MLSLEAHWSNNEALWLSRSEKFMSVVKQGKVSETFIAYHPGVTTMWIAGLRTLFAKPDMNVENLALARWFIGIFVWVGIGVVSLLLYQLFGRWVAVASFACLAYSPLFLAQTRSVHTDALAATFILLTVLLFLLYRQNPQHPRYLVFSGIAFGLALLSKSYALILLPWIPICQFLFREKHTAGFRAHIAEGICFLNCTFLIVLIVWPVFWTLDFGLIALCLLALTYVILRAMKEECIQIGTLFSALVGLILVCVRATQTLRIIFESINWAITTPHETEKFFLGNIVNDPGWSFYLLVLTLKSTPFMLPLALAGCFLLWKQRKNTVEKSRQFRMVLALVAGILLFAICLTATSKKMPRYLLPIFLMLEILAAIGFIHGLQWSYAALCSHFGTAETAKYKTAFAIITCIGFFVIQIAPVLARHPYYGTYYNICWKVTDITKIITIGDASGLDIAAKYLNQKPNARHMVILASPLAAQFIFPYLQGRVYRVDRLFTGHPNPDYEVVYIRDSQIGRVPQTGTLNGELEAVITLNGIDHVWIYRIQRK